MDNSAEGTWPMHLSVLQDSEATNGSRSSISNAVLGCRYGVTVRTALAESKFWLAVTVRCLVTVCGFV